MRPDTHPPTTERVLTLDVAAARADAWRRAGQRIVLTNGCFDLLHLGHVRYLEAARRLGDVLVVAVNDDASVAALKGAGRPITAAGERAEIVAALRSVDAVVVFDGATAVEVVRRLRPDVYAKGGDYDARANRPPEADAAEALGGEVVFLPLVAGRSTRELATRLRDRA